MDELIVTFTRAVEDRSALGWFPLPSGRSARTETIEIGAESAAGALVATASESVVWIDAPAECWVAIGAAPEAAAGSGWHLAAGESRPFGAQAGDKVAVIQA